MKTPSASELLVQETRTAERLRLLMLANECKTITPKSRALRKGRFSHLWDCKNGHNLGIIALKTAKNY